MLNSAVVGAYCTALRPTTHTTRTITTCCAIAVAVAASLLALHLQFNSDAMPVQYPRGSWVVPAQLVPCVPINAAAAAAAADMNFFFACARRRGQSNDALPA